jgi:GH24 family phage-related lysozyme (muramidase)
MGGGSQTTSSGQTNTPNANAMAAYNNVLGGAQNIVNANQNWNPATGVNVADWTGAQSQSLGEIGALQGGYAPAMAAATNLVGQAGQGVGAQDINSFMNPYTQDVINSTMANAQQQQAIGMKNVLGNSIAQGALGGDRTQLAQAYGEGQNALANNQTIAGLEQGGYNSALAAAQAQKGQELQAGYGMANVAQAGQSLGLQGASALYGAGAAQQGQAQNVLNAASQNAQSATMWPYQNYQWLANIAGGIGSLMGGTTTGTNTTEQHPGFANYLGMGLGGLSAMSDRRLKENVEHVGELYDGQPVYAFNYKGDGVRQIGLMAQDVEKKHPEATGEYAGYKTVDYGAATHDAAKKGHFADGGSAYYSYDPWGDLLGHPMTVKEAQQQQQAQPQPQSGGGGGGSSKGLLGLGLATGGSTSDPWGDLLGHPMEARQQQQQQPQPAPQSSSGSGGKNLLGFADGGSPWGGMLNQPIKRYGSSVSMFPGIAPAGPGPQSLSEAAKQTKEGAQSGQSAIKGAKNVWQQMQGGQGGQGGIGGADAATGASGADAATGAATGTEAATTAGTAAETAGTAAETAAAETAAAGSTAAGVTAGEGGGLFSLLAAIFAAKGGGIEHNRDYHELGNGDPYTGFLLDALTDDERGDHAARALGKLTGGRVNGGAKEAVRGLMKGFDDGGDVDPYTVRGPLSDQPDTDFGRPVNPRGFTNEAPAAPEPVAPVIHGALTGAPPLDPERKVAGDNDTVTGPLHDYDRDPVPHYSPLGQPVRPLSEAPLPLAEAGGPPPPSPARQYAAPNQPTRLLSEAPLPLSEAPTGEIQRHAPGVTFPAAQTTEHPLGPRVTDVADVGRKAVEENFTNPARDFVREKIATPYAEAAQNILGARAENAARGAGNPDVGDVGRNVVNDALTPHPLTEREAADSRARYQAEQNHTWTAFKDWISSKLPPDISDERLAAIRADYAQKQAQTGQSFKEYLKAHIPEFDADALAKRLGRTLTTSEDAAASRAERANEQANAPGFGERAARAFGHDPITKEEIAQNQAERAATLGWGEQIANMLGRTVSTPQSAAESRAERAAEQANPTGVSLLDRLTLRNPARTEPAAPGPMAPAPEINKPGAAPEPPELPERANRPEVGAPAITPPLPERARPGMVGAPVAPIPQVPDLKPLLVTPEQNAAFNAREAERHKGIRGLAALPSLAPREPNLVERALSQAHRNLFSEHYGDQRQPEAAAAPAAPAPVAPAPATVNTENAPRPVQTFKIAPTGETLPQEGPTTAGEWTFDAAANKWTKQAAPGAEAPAGTAAPAAAPAATRGPTPVGATEPAPAGAPEPGPAGIPGQGGPTRVSDNGVNYLKRVERFSPTPYNDHGQISIGYGTRVKPGDKTITEEQATERLRDETGYVSNWINQNIKTPLTQAQYDMLVSFGYNTGTGDAHNKRGLQAIKDDVNKGDWDTVYNRMRSFNKAKDEEGNYHVVPGLNNRRENDIKLGKGEQAIEGVARLPAGQAAKLPKQAEKAQEEANAEAEKAQEKTEPVAHTQARRGLIESIFGGGGQGGAGGEGGLGGLGQWNLLEGITGPGKAGKDTWNPLGLTTAQRQNLMLTGLAMAGGSPLGWQAMGAGVQGLQAASGLQTAEQQREMAPAELAIRAAQVPKFGVFHSVNAMTGLQESSVYDVHTGKIVAGPGSEPGSNTAGAGAAAGAIPAHLHGNEAIAAFPQSRQGELKGVVSGDIPITNYRAGPQREFWENAARQVDENWSPAKIDARNEYRKGIIKQSSKEGMMAHSINAGTQHMGSMLAIDPHLSDHSALRATATNWWKEKLGDDPYLSAWKTESLGLADEVAKIQGGGAGAEAEKLRWLDKFSPNQPRAVRMANVNAALDILDGHLKDMDRKYDTEVGQYGNKYEIAGPENRGVIQKARDMFSQSFGGKKFPGTEREAPAAPAPQPARQAAPGAAPQVTLPEAKQVYKAAMAAGRIDLAKKVVERAAAAGIPPEQLQQ